jgi:FkbM family methyltransferase
MMKLKNLLSGEFTYQIAQYLKFKIDRYLDKRAEKDKQSIENCWLSNFGNEEWQEHFLSDTIRLKLYRDSNLSRLIYDGFEENELRFTKKVLREGDIFIDIGANIGLYSLIASPIVGNSGKVISFEPAPKTYARLKENIKLNNLTNISALNLGLSDSEGHLQLNISESGYEAWNTFAPTISERFKTSELAAVSTIDSQFSGIDKSLIKFVKIDVEGWEKYVLLGGVDLFKNYSPIVMIEFTETNTFSAGYFVQELYDILYDWGYRWYRFVDNELIPEKKLLHYPYDNLIATKSILWVETLIKDPPF